MLGVRIRGTLGDIDPLNRLPFKRARSRAKKGLLSGVSLILRLMDKILHDPKDPKLWELWYIPYYG